MSNEAHERHLHAIQGGGGTPKKTFLQKNWQWLLPVGLVLLVIIGGVIWYSIEDAKSPQPTLPKERIEREVEEAAQIEWPGKDNAKAFCQKYFQNPCDNHPGDSFKGVQAYWWFVFCDWQ